MNLSAIDQIDFIDPDFSIDIDNDINTTEIYTCFDDLLENDGILTNSFEPHTGQGPNYAPKIWGIHKTKPEAQTDWENLTKTAIDSAIFSNIDALYPSFHVGKHRKIPNIFKCSGCGTHKGADIRPKVYDRHSKKWLLVDSGAMVSVFPKHYYPHAKIDHTTTLQAVNKSCISTYGSVKRNISFNNKKTYSQEVLIADIDEPVIGWDMIFQYKLNLVWSKNGKECTLVDRKAGISSKLKLEQVTPDTRLNLAPIDIATNDPQKYNTFQKWSQAQAAKANQGIRPPPIPTEFKALLDEYPDIQKLDFHADTPKHGVTHNIDTGNNPPCTAKLRPLLPNSPKALKGEANWRELEKLGIIERVDPQECNTWTSALHLVPKPDGELRVCGDFRPLNERTLLDGFPLPNLRSFAGNIKGSKVFSRVELMKAFHQIPLDPESQKKTVVVTPWGAWKFRRLPMGLRNAAQSFQRLMTHVLAGMTDIFCYMDDVLIFSKSKEEHMKTIRELFRRLSEAGLAISLKKCLFGVATLDFVGYRVDSSGIKPLPKKLEAITGFPTPEKPKQLLGFLGAVNYYRRALPKVNGKTAAETLQPLYDIATKKIPGKTFTQIWKENNMQSTFEAAKEMLKQACELAHPDVSAPIALTTDASKSAIGGVLEQFSDGMWQPLGFWSRHLKDSETRWSTFRRELYAVQCTASPQTLSARNRGATCSDLYRS